MTTSCARSRASSLVRIRLPDSADKQAYVPALEAAGYVLRAREPGWFEHRLLKGPILLFRDWLRANDADRDAYLQVKHDLAGRTWRHVQHYADAKTAIVEQVIARATRHRPGPRPG